MFRQFLLLLSLFGVFEFGEIRLKVQEGTPTAIGNFVYPHSGCDFLGVGGQVWDLYGDPIVGLVIKVAGILEGEVVSLYTLTGSSEKFGESGYDFTLGDHVISSNNSLYLQLYNLLGEEISARYHFSTYQDCERNLILINWTE